MKNYCVVPPYVKTDIQPNVLIILDNSNNMKNAAYDSNGDGTLDPYLPATQYVGYFVYNQWYSYVGNQFEPDNGVVPSDPNSDDAVGAFYGNILNWALTSKFDLLESILVGGKSVNPFSSPNTLKAETNTWTGTYTGCIFNVNNGSLVITETVLNACSLIRSPRVQLTYLEGLRFARNSGVENGVKDEALSQKPPKENANFFSNISSRLIKKLGSSMAYIMDLLASDAEAAAALKITTNTVPNGQVCQLYAKPINASGGTSPYTWSAAGLPTGLLICTGAANCTYIFGATTYTYSPGTIYGVPTTAGDSTFTVTVTDSVAASYIQTFTITVAGIPGIAVSTTTLPDAITDGDDLAPLSPYSTTLTATGGCPAYTWSIVAGSLPGSFTLNPSTGVISSANVLLAEADSYPFTVRVTDFLGAFADKPLSLLVKTSTVHSESFNAWSCVGTYSNNCYCAGCTPSKKGLVDDFLNKARFGLETFKEVSGNIDPEIPSGTCISPGQTSNFSTAIQQVNMVSGVAPLVEGISYASLSTETNTGAISYYKNNADANCNPFRDISNNPCLKNFILMLTSGEGANTDEADTGFADATNCPPTQGGVPGADYDLSKNACYGFKNDLRADPLTGIQKVSTYVVNTMGGYTCVDGATTVPCSTILEQTARKSGGTYYSTTDPTQLKAKIQKAFEDIIQRAAAGTAASVLASGEGSGANLIQAVFYPRRKFINTGPAPDYTNTEDEVDWVGRLTNLWYYVDPFFGNSNIRADDGDKILDLDTNVATSGDYIVELYYDAQAESTKARRYHDTDGDAVKETTPALADVAFENLQNLWEAGTELWARNISTSPRTIYTPLLTGGTQVGSTGLMLFPRYDSVAAAMTPLANVTALFNLAATPQINYFDLPSTDRDVNTFIDGDLDGDLALDADDGNVLMRYIHGESDFSLRPRSVKVNLNAYSDNDTLDAGESSASVWRLGDILNSTPKTSTWMPLNSFHKTFKDTTYGESDKDPSLDDADKPNYYIARDFARSGIDGVGLGSTFDGYRKRDRVYTGANDGMLHAFKLGTLDLTFGGQTTTQKATLTGADLGKEMWAFIPKNVLPYLKYMTENEYCHLYSVDLTPYIFDASINIDYDTNDSNSIDGADTQPTECTASDYWRCKKTKDSWRTILIGGMRYGGACKNSTTTCSAANSYDLNGIGGVTDDDCVKTPMDGVGLSSYFALDITDQDNPRLLWEFSDPNLGFTTTGPSIVRINSRTAGATTSAADPTTGTGATNGRWFVIFGSGPTGPIVNTNNQRQFLGKSDQNMRLFVLDLKTGSPLRTIDTGINYGFAGSMLNTTQDVDLDYQDDVVYVPYVKKQSASDAWTDGGILRLITKEDLSGNTLGGSGACASGMTALNPNCWAVSTVMDGIGPVASSVVKLLNTRTDKFWLYFGTGRYYYELGNETDDADSQRHLFGITEPCYATKAFTYDTTTAVGTSCTTSRTTGQLSDVNLSGEGGVTDDEGWRILLDMCTNSAGTVVDCSNPSVYFKTERIITDPVATSSGVVFFTSYKPYIDQCSLGGKSSIWAVKYDTGGAAGSLLKGKAIVQVSTGSIEQVNLSSAFTQKGGRRTSAMEGVPPTAQGLSLMSTPPALKRVLHIRER